MSEVASTGVIYVWDPENGEHPIDQQTGENVQIGEIWVIRPK